MSILYIINGIIAVLGTIMVQVFSIVLVYRALIERDISLIFLSILFLLLAWCLAYVVIDDIKKKIINKRDAESLLGLQKRRKSRHR